MPTTPVSKRGGSEWLIRVAKVLIEREVIDREEFLQVLAGKPVAIAA